ncbi:hypothetical protein II810_01565, partial [bacterium]|nr:hypothetical protein [bacterium]
MPTTTFAQAAENPKTPETPKFIFSVESFEDGKALSAELSYSVLIDDKVKIEEKSLSIDDEGKAEIEEIAALEENITNSNVVLIYKVTKNDYKDVSGEYEIKKADDTLSVKLEKIEKVSVTVNVNESNRGIVEIDNESVDGTIKVNKGKEIEIKISTKVAEEFENYKGFHIKSVKINEENQKLDDNNLNNFSKIVTADDNINIDVEFEKYYSFTIEKYSEDCGIVTVNDEKYESGNFDESSQVKLDIKANEGYRISSIFINDESEELNDFDKYSKTFYLDKNSSVKVEFVKIYIVNIKYDSSNGKVETEPEIESDGGSVQIGDGSILHIKAIPNENFRVSNVSVTGFQEEIYDNNNFSIDNPYEKDLEIKQDAEISITFAPMVYKISLGNVSPNGSVTIENNNRTVDYDKTSVIKFIPDKGYKVGKILSNGEDVNDFIKPSEIEDGVYILTLNNVKEDKVLDISFIESEKADFDKVEISYSDSEKPLRTEKNDAYNLYVFRNGASAVLKPSDSDIGIRIN